MRLENKNIWCVKTQLGGVFKTSQPKALTQGSDRCEAEFKTQFDGTCFIFSTIRASSLFKKSSKKVGSRSREIMGLKQNFCICMEPKDLFLCDLVVIYVILLDAVPVFFTEGN